MKFNKKILTLSAVAFSVCLSPLKTYAASNLSNIELGSNKQVGISIAPDFYKPGYSVAYYQETNVTDFLNSKEMKTAPFARIQAIRDNKNLYNYKIPSGLPAKVGTSSSPLEGDQKVEGSKESWSIWNTWTGGVSDSVKNRVPYFVFPRALSIESTELDKTEAQRVEKYLVTDLNKAIDFVVKESGWKAPEDERKRVEDFFKLTAALGNIKETSTFTFNGKEFVGVFEDDTKKTGRVKIQVKGGESTGFLYYQINTYKSIKDDKSREEEYKKRSGVWADERMAKLNWNQVVYYGNASYIVTGLNSMNQNYELNSEDDGLFEKLLASMFRGLYDALDSMLGTERFEKLMLGKGEMYTWYGVAPAEWFNISGVLFWVFQVLAWIILPGAVVKLFTSNLVDSSNTFARVQLMEGARDILIAAFLLTLISPIFELLAKFNYLFVDIIANLTNSNVAILKGDGLVGEIAGHGGLAGAILLLVYFGLNVYFNAIFILRAVAVCLLYGLSPAFTMLYAFGGKYKSLTLRFYKEVVGNIFIGSFYAVIVTFYAMFYNNGSGSTKGLLISFVLMWAFIPMTKLFKSLTGIGESDFVSQTAATAQSKVQGAVKDYVTNPAKRGVKGLAEGSYKAYKAGGQIKESYGKLEEEKKKNDEKGIKSQISGYDDGALGRNLGLGAYTLGTVFNNKTLKEIGMDKINNSGNAGKLEYEKQGGPKYTKAEEGAGYSGTDINEKGNYEHSFKKDDLVGIKETRMSGDGKNVEQTYSKAYVEKHKDFFDVIEKGNQDSEVQKKLQAKGIKGSRVDGEGNVTVQYSAQKLDVEGVRNDGANIIVERGSSVTKPTADLTDQIGDLSSIISTLEGSTTRNESASTKIERDARELVDGMNDEKK